MIKKGINGRFRDYYVPKVRRGRMTTSYSKGKYSDFGLGAQDAPIVERENLSNETMGAEIDLCKVSLSVGITKSLGNYEFIRVDIGCEDWCDRTKKEETWIHLEEELQKKAKLVIADLMSTSKIKTPPVSASMKNNIPPPVVDEVKVLLSLKKKLNDLLLKLNNEGILNHQSAIEKLKTINVDKVACEKLIAELENGNYSFFEETEIVFENDTFSSLE